MQAWQIILTSLGGSGALSAILVFILREWISTRIRKSIEHEYKVKEISLRAELDGKLEGVRAGYKKLLDENQIRYSRLYTDQAEATKTLYQLLDQMDSKLGHLVSPMQIVPKDPEKQQVFYDKQHQDAVDAFNACSAFFHENRILLPEDLCTEMDETLSIAKKAYHDFARRSRRPEKWDEAYDAMRGPFASLKKKLEARFRQVLGLLPAQSRSAEASEAIADRLEDAGA